MNEKQVKDNAQVRHGGCANCGSLKVPLLYSVHTTGMVMGKAVCEPCATLVYQVNIKETTT